MRQFRYYFFFALLTSFVISLAYFSDAKQNSDDVLSTSLVPEIADYERDIEDNIDDDPLFLASTLLGQSLNLDRVNIVNSHGINPNFSHISYRARPRSPPLL